MIAEATAATFKDTVARGVVLVDFWATWCGPCKMQGPILENLAPAYEGRVSFAKLNIEEPGAKDIALEFGIRSIPALLVFKDGAEVNRLVGLTRPDALSAALDAALS